MPSLFGKPGKPGPTAGRAKPRQKSIRGTISAPIPIPSTPDDDEFPIRLPGTIKASKNSDDEFPMRQPGTGIASPDLPSSSPDEAPEPRTDLPEETIPNHPTTPPPAPPPQSFSTPPGRSPSRPASRSPQNRLVSQKTPPPLADLSPKTSAPTRRATNPVLNSVRYSVVSDVGSRQTSQSKDAPQRKKSTLRSALGRLFGRGKKKNGNGGHHSTASIPERESKPMGSAQHLSDPTALSRPQQRSSPKRSASLPLSEFDRPLRSHSVGPDDIMAIESARNSVHVDPSGSSTALGIRRRAATTHGHALLLPHLVNREFGAGLSPRPSSAHGRGSRAGVRSDPDDPGEIGRAITSDSGGGLRRRSRSLSGLQDFAGVSQGGSRRRSDEIRYWRESYNPGFMSPLSSNTHDDYDDTGLGDTSAPESPAAEKPPKTPPQPFNFGVLSKEMMGMKITHAADMDTRLANIETRTAQLERVVDKLYLALPNLKTPGGTRDTTRPSSSRRSIETDTHSQLSLSEYQTYTTALHPLSAATPRTKPPIISPPALPSPRPTSTATIRGAASLPHLSHEDAGTPPTDLVTKLRAELDAERSAREALEAQVKKLSDRLNSLSTTMFAMVRGPSESRSHERLNSPASSSIGGNSPTPHLPTTPRSAVLSGIPPIPPVPREHQHPPHSVFETDDDDDDNGTNDEGRSTKRSSAIRTTIPAAPTSAVDEGEITEDDFQTPREERTPLVGYGAFGEELRSDDYGDDDDDYDDHDENGNGNGNGGDGSGEELKRKKAARTLSLSQLTLGKGQRTRI
ncbi:uncharacterized protein C8A04DRAFT_10569 [Dichotomopilus funicola]|uniref:Uncharacterized protein n=1 Tax=Dichotomopilus funicola TaxID=1934379 RepID=A0AAN6V6Y8_9PEZI|nr:hypothetical protein C8A04DRAFT_10569 [Dichotomopilus funicola]